MKYILSLSVLFFIPGTSSIPQGNKGSVSPNNTVSQTIENSRYIDTFKHNTHLAEDLTDYRIEKYLTTDTTKTMP